MPYTTFDKTYFHYFNGRCGMKSIIWILFCLMAALLPNATLWAWTNGSWERGDSINWGVPYQSQESLRNWTTACMPTSGAMIVNFFYSGAPRTEYNDTNNQIHPWTSQAIPNPYTTTGQRIYALGINGNNDADTTISDYLLRYPKNGLGPPTYNQFYCTNVDGCVNAFFGPLRNEALRQNAGTSPSFTNTSDGTPGYKDSLINYLSKKHTIEAEFLGFSPSISAVRNALYLGPVIMSVKTSCSSGHIIVVKGVNSNGDFIVNDPWNGSLCNSPSDQGNNSIYTVSGNLLRAYGNDHTIYYAYSVPVLSNYERVNC